MDTLTKNRMQIAIISYLQLFSMNFVTGPKRTYRGKTTRRMEISQSKKLKNWFYVVLKGKTLLVFLPHSYRQGSLVTRFSCNQMIQVETGNLYHVIYQQWSHNSTDHCSAPLLLMFWSHSVNSAFLCNKVIWVLLAKVTDTENTASSKNCELHPCSLGLRHNISFQLKLHLFSHKNWQNLAQLLCGIKGKKYSY